MYNGVDIKKGLLARMYQPIVLSRRLLFVMVPYMVSRFPFAQIQFLVFLNFFFSMYYIGVRPHLGGKRKLLTESHNESMIIFLTYHMFLFTDFVPMENVDFVYDVGNSFVMVIAEILFVNIGLLVFDMANEQRLKKKKQRAQMEYEARFKQFQETQMELYFKRCAAMQEKTANIK